MKNPHAVALGKKGGKAKTKAKAEASKVNGKLGGRPSKAKLRALKRNRELRWGK